MDKLPPTDSNNDKPSILKNTREAKGLTLEIVHEATKIPMDALRAIEEGYSTRILSPFYYRGFIKIYAEFLGLDVGEMYKQYGINQPPKPSSVVVATAKGGRREPKPNEFLENTQDWLSSVFKPKTLGLIFRIIGFLLLFFILFKISGCVVAHIHQKSPTAVKQNWPPEKKVKSYDGVNQTVTAPSEDNRVEVAVRASKDTWLRVKADDKVVFETTLSKGSMESWSANDRIELSGRDIEQLDMEVNDRQIGFLGGGEHRIRRVIITQEGLTVKK